MFTKSILSLIIPNFYTVHTNKFRPLRLSSVLHIIIRTVSYIM